MTGIVAAGFRSAILLDLYLGYSSKLYRTSVYAIPESCGCEWIGRWCGKKYANYAPPRVGALLDRARAT
jgi:hypothetical protein